MRDGNAVPQVDHRHVCAEGRDLLLGKVLAQGGAQLRQHGLVVEPRHRLGERQCGLLAWGVVVDVAPDDETVRSEEHTSELQSLMRISYAVFCLKKNKTTTHKKRQQDVQH